VAGCWDCNSDHIHRIDEWTDTIATGDERTGCTATRSIHTSDGCPHNRTNAQVNLTGRAGSSTYPGDTSTDGEATGTADGHACGNGDI